MEGVVPRSGEGRGVSLPVRRREAPPQASWAAGPALGNCSHLACQACACSSGNPKRRPQAATNLP